MTAVEFLTYNAPPICDADALKYAGGAFSEESVKLLQRVKEEAKDAFCYKVCYTVCDVCVDGVTVDFGFFKTESAALAKNLSGVKRAVIFAATVGFEIDRLIMKHSRLSPSRALMLGALGAERIEALCDAFCEDIKRVHGVCRPRFSAGYGDLSIEVQREIFKLLNPETKMGLTLTDSMLMSPTKSVTAFIGIGE